MAKSNVSAAYLDVLLVAGRGGGLVCLQWVAAQVGSADSTSCVCCVCVQLAIAVGLIFSMRGGRPRGEPAGPPYFEIPTTTPVETHCGSIKYLAS